MAMPVNLETGSSRAGGETVDERSASTVRQDDYLRESEPSGENAEERAVDGSTKNRY